jgi:hypothetical protein
MSYNPQRTGPEPAMTHPLIALARQSVTDPRGAARALTARPLPPPVLVDALALVAVLGGIVGTLFSMLVLSVPAPPEITPEELTRARENMAGPFRQTVVQAGGMVLVALAIWGIGRMFGGTGGLRDTIAVTIWLSALALAIQVALILLLMVLPPLGVLALIAAAILNLWLLTNFVAELHGFGSAWNVLFAMIGVAFALALLLAILAPLAAPGAGG